MKKKKRKEAKKKESSLHRNMKHKSITKNKALIGDTKNAISDMKSNHLPDPKSAYNSSQRNPINNIKK